MMIDQPEDFAQPFQRKAKLRMLIERVRQAIGTIGRFLDDAIMPDEFFASPFSRHRRFSHLIVLTPHISIAIAPHLPACRHIARWDLTGRDYPGPPFRSSRFVKEIGALGGDSLAFRQPAGRRSAARSFCQRPDQTALSSRSRGLN